MATAIYNGIEIENTEQKTTMIHSRVLAAMNQDHDTNTNYRDKLYEIKRADVPQDVFDAINKLHSIVKMDYQICNGGIEQYFFNGYDKHYITEDKEVELFDKNTQVETLHTLYLFATTIFPDNVEKNSRLNRIIDFFDSMEEGEEIFYEIIECDEPEEIENEETGELEPNPNWFESSEEEYTEKAIISNKSEYHLCDFNSEYYKINEYIETLIELYSQYIYKAKILPLEKTNIVEYLGITDNDDEDYKRNCIEEYKTMKEKYASDQRRIEYCCTEDLGVYIPYTEIIETGKHLSAFTNEKIIEHKTAFEQYADKHNADKASNTEQER